jgi:large subunit ribosomal protein L9
MKVILLEDVYKHGVAGDMVDVAPGFARNYLFPRSMAAKATPGSIKQFANLRKTADVRRATLEKKYEAIAEQVRELELAFPVKAGETGKLYGSVTNAMIAEKLHELIGLDIDSRRVGDRALRELGVFDVPVRLDTGLTPAIKVIVHREGEDPQDRVEAERQADLAEAEAEALEEMEAEAEEAAQVALAAEVEVEADVEAEPAEELDEIEASEE